MSEETQENHADDIGDSTGKPVAKERPKQTPRPTSPSPTITLPYHQRKWIDVEPGKFDKNCIEASKQMTRLHRHDHTVLREDDGAIEFRTLASMFHSKSTSSPYWFRTWLNYLQLGGGAKQRYHYCVDPCSADTILYLRAIFKAILEENTLILHCKTTCCRRAHLPRWKLP